MARTTTTIDVDAALAACETLARRSHDDIAAVLANAAARWQANPVLRAGLAAATGLSRAMIATTLPTIAAAIDREAMSALASRELGAQRPTRPGVVGHIVASNVPALAVPMMALSALAGVACLVRSGRHDPLSAPAFHAAVAEIDSTVAATMITIAGPFDPTVFARADRIVASGSTETMATLGTHFGDRLVAHGTRTSIVVVARGTSCDVDALARDVALYDQRGCLSPRIVYCEDRVEPFATRLASALGHLGRTLPMGRLDITDHAALRAIKDEAEWSRTVRLHARPDALVLVDDVPTFLPPASPRTIRVHAVPDLDAVPELLPIGAVECVGYTGDPTRLVPAFRTRGVARLCPVGQMQAPPLAWPRGQRAPLQSLLGLASEPHCEVER